VQRMTDVKVLSHSLTHTHSHSHTHTHTHTRTPTFTNLDQNSPLSEFALMNMSVVWDVRDMSVGEFFEALEDEEGVCVSVCVCVCGRGREREGVYVCV